MRLGVRLPVAMVVAAPRRDESEAAGEARHRRDGLAVVAVVVDLDAAQADLDELADRGLAVGRIGRVGEDREPAGGPDGEDRVAWPDPVRAARTRARRCR